MVLCIAVWWYVVMCCAVWWYVVVYGVWCCLVLCGFVCWSMLVFVVSGGVLQFLVVYGVVRLWNTGTWQDMFPLEKPCCRIEGLDVFDIFLIFDQSVVSKFIYKTSSPRNCEKSFWKSIWQIQIVLAVKQHNLIPFNKTPGGKFDGFFSQIVLVVSLFVAQ